MEVADYYKNSQFQNLPGRFICVVQIESHVYNIYNIIHINCLNKHCILHGPLILQCEFGLR